MYSFNISLQLKDLDSHSAVKGSFTGHQVEISSASSEPPSKDQMQRLEKEIKEQEELIVRFQTENKRLYEEIRGKEKTGKATEEAMFKENQRLNVELNSLRYYVCNFWLLSFRKKPIVIVVVERLSKG